MAKIYVENRKKDDYYIMGDIHKKRIPKTIKMDEITHEEFCEISSRIRNLIEAGFIYFYELNDYFCSFYLLANEKRPIRYRLKNLSGVFLYPKEKKAKFNFHAYPGGAN